VLQPPGSDDFLTVAQHGLMGDMKTPSRPHLPADTVILLRYFEAFTACGRPYPSSKRTSAHEDTIREYRIRGGRHSPGRPLTNFPGVLRGVPAIMGDGPAMAKGRKSDPHLSERGLILAPAGQDAEVAAAMLAEAHVRSAVCSGLPDLVAELKASAGFAIVTEEALHTSTFIRWRTGSTPSRNGRTFLHPADAARRRPERNPMASRLLHTLGNVTFLERPFHPTTLVSLTQAAIRGRRAPVRGALAAGRAAHAQRDAGGAGQRGSGRAAQGPGPPRQGRRTRCTRPRRWRASGSWRAAWRTISTIS
jgi:hypothetical protein